MIEQETLFPLAPLVTPATRADDTIQDRFERFHEANGWVYDALVSLARDYISGGRTRLGIGMLFERLRWDYNRSTTGDPFKLSNDYRSRYSRLIMANEHELEGVFATRELTSA